MEILRLDLDGDCGSSNTTVVGDLGILKMRGLSLCIGNFDGVHIGHQELIKLSRNYALSENLYSAVLTFDPHPSVITGNISQIKDNSAKLYKSILNSEQKAQKIAEMNIDYLLNLKFSKVIMEMSPESFVKNVLIDVLGVRRIFTGYNFAFGKGRAGNSELLSALSVKYGFCYSIVNKVMRNYIDVSSSKIKEMLNIGAVQIVSDMLGARYSIEGIVVQGSKIAKEKLGIATANITLKNCDIIYPLNGVYFVRVFVANSKESYFGLANIGLRPTLNPNYADPDEDLVLEVHLFECEFEIYGKNIKVEFLQLMRPERRFSDIEELRIQISLDIRHAKYLHQILKSHF